MTNHTDIPTPTTSTTSTTSITGTAAGVPFIAVPPATLRPDAPVVAVWHLMDPPATETAMAAALPLRDVDAWRIYFGLPLTGARLPDGGFDELMRLGYEDPVCKMYGPLADLAIAEFPAAYSELAERLGFGDGALAVVGGSMGAAVAALALTEGTMPISAAVLISPLLDLRRAIDVGERRYGMTYEWSPTSDGFARRLDVVTRAGEIVAHHGAPAVLSIVGADDDAIGFHEPAHALRAALAASYPDPSLLAVEVIEGMGHAFAEAPGFDAAAQTKDAIEVDRRTAAWLTRHLPAA